MTELDPKMPPPVSLWPHLIAKRRAWAVNQSVRLHQGEATSPEMVMDDALALIEFVMTGTPPDPDRWAPVLAPINDSGF